jgi:Family of unknown function (DUF6065)
MSVHDDSARLDDKDSNMIPTGRSLIAYRMPGWSRYMEIVPAPADRFWMDFGTKGWANRCLPLRIANQSGWWILNDVEFEAKWNGKPQLDGVTLTTKKGSKAPSADSMFGYGVLTWSIPYLFQTPERYSLYVRGPCNLWKDGIIPLDAMPETDWLPYPFTMNWRFTRPFKTVKFEKDEPICMIVPVRRGEAEEFEPEIRNLESSPELLRSFQTWNEHRTASMREREAGTPRMRITEKGGHYVRGEGYLGERAHGHQVKLDVKRFVQTEDPPAVSVVQQRNETSGARRLGWLQRFFSR